MGPDAADPAYRARRVNGGRWKSRAGWAGGLDGSSISSSRTASGFRSEFLRRRRRAVRRGADRDSKGLPRRFKVADGSEAPLPRYVFAASDGRAASAPGSQDLRPRRDHAFRTGPSVNIGDVQVGVSAEARMQASLPTFAREATHRWT